jgi:5-formyltetrahydrofolate cyclo-ligase
LKREIRKQALAARDGMTSAERERKSRAIEERLFSLSEFKSSRVVMFFASFRSEVETERMIRRALLSGKRVVLPKVRGGELGLFEIRDFDKDVSPGAWNIPEPHEFLPAELSDIDLIVMPGAAFDERGNRVGYGAGFYDKLLPDFQKTTVALAFEGQMVPQVPASPHDIPVKKIVTERRIITARSA